MIGITLGEAKEAAQSDKHRKMITTNVIIFVIGFLHNTVYALPPPYTPVALQVEYGVGVLSPASQPVVTLLSAALYKGSTALTLHHHNNV